MDKSLKTSKQSPPSLQLVLPRVFEYRDYRSYLKDWFLARKAKGYSGAMFAKRAGLASHTLLGMIIRGERNLGYTTIRSFAKALDLKARETLYFEKLVLFNQAKTSEERTEYFNQLVHLSQGQGELAKVEGYANYLAHWSTVVIRELVLLEDFQEDFEWMSEKLKRHISKKQAETSWQILKELNLVEQDPQGKWRQSSPSLDIDPGSADFAVRNYHKQYLDLAKDFVDSEPIEERELNSLTLGTDKEQLAKLKEEISEFRKDLNLRYSKEKNSDRPAEEVITLNIQLLKLTRTKGTKNL